MKINVVTKNGVSSISFQCKTDFNEVLDKNLAAICEAIADKGVIIKELLNLFEGKHSINYRCNTYIQ